MFRMMIKPNSSHIETNSLALSAVDLATPSSEAATLRLSSQTILRGCREVEIEHHGMVYRLRCTSLGKLILTK